MIINNTFLRLLCFSFVAIGLAYQTMAEETRLKFNRDIRPILSENCFACHGFDEKSRQAELRLDLPEAAFADRDGMPPISPKNLDKSSVWQRIISVDPDEQMPPPSSHLELSVADKETIRKWIEQGAEYESHWSLIRPQRPAIPGLETAVSPANHPIDAFIRDRLTKEKLVVNSKADRETLLRRVYIDLTGLPPSIEQRNAFLANEQPDAFASLVEQLLDSPHYGERMAMEWMDAARYADTNGFSIDGGRHIWLWRDWVIQAFNDNKPYDDFLLEQIAGDLLPNRTDAQLIATGFQRNNMVTHEGGTIPEENLTNYNADRVKTLGEAVLGLTFGCAQCHNHKFDPFTQQDYYQLFAYFNTLEDKGLDGNNGVNPAPYTSFKTILQTDELDSLTKEIASIENELSKVDDSILNAWMNQQRAILQQRGTDFQLHPVKVMKISTPNRGEGFDVAGESQVKIRNAGALGAFDVLTELPKVDRPITGVRITALPQKDLPGGGWGQGLTKPPKPAKPDKKEKKETKEGSPESTPETKDPEPKDEEPPEKGSFRLTAVSITLDTVPSDQVNLHRLESIRRVTANSWESAHPPSHILDPRNETGWSPDRETEGAVHLTATLTNPAMTASNPYMTIQLNFGAGNNYIPGMVELAVITGTDDGIDLPKDIVELLHIDSEKRTAEETKRLWDYCSEHCDSLQTKRIARDNLRDRWKHLTQSFPTMVMNTAQKPRETFILNRGDYSQPTVAVTAATPSSIGPKLEDAPKNRLGLAQWIVHRDNPLTARVAVNRLWQMFFGTGIVATSADFGSQGEWPSHPELLDWLAVELIEHDWDIQHIVRLIVSSEAYQRASTSTPEQLAVDPQNRLLARGPRFRLSAEMVRDAALKSSGLLVHRIGGPSVNPYMPVDLWREVSHYGSTPATAQVFVQDHGEKLYRRSMYTYWKRTAPPPNMMAFDAPNREVCTVARAGTTTPLQSLVTLNDVQFVECARNLAQDVLKHSTNDTERVRRAFRLCLTRDPRPEEVKIVLSMIAKEIARYRANPQLAALVLSNGESPRDQTLDSVEHAAWTQIASMILNLSETITRN
jgi:hypothetical protein